MASRGYRIGQAIPWLSAAICLLSVGVGVLTLRPLLGYDGFANIQAGTGLLMLAIPAAVIGLRILVRPMRLPQPAPEPSALLVPASTEPEAPDPVDLLLQAKWWVRYPASLGFFAGGYYIAMSMNGIIPWGFAAVFILFGLLLIRELVGLVLAALVVGLILWLLGATAAALPVSGAIIIGAMIIAVAVKH